MDRAFLGQVIVAIKRITHTGKWLSARGHRNLQNRVYRHSDRTLAETPGEITAGRALSPGGTSTVSATGTYRD
jgi:hypothetical protein